MIIWFIGLALIGLFIGLYLLGYFLPKPYSNSANLVLRHSPQEVWQAIANMDALPVTGSTHHHVQRISEAEALPVWLIDMGSSQITVQTIQADPPQKLIRVMADSVVPITTRYDYTLDAMGSGTDLTIREEGFVDRGTWHAPIFRLMVRLMRGAGLRLYCRQLAAFLGETAVPSLNQKS